MEYKIKGEQHTPNRHQKYYKVMYKKLDEICRSSLSNDEVVEMIYQLTRNQLRSLSKDKRSGMGFISALVDISREYFRVYWEQKSDYGIESDVQILEINHNLDIYIEYELKNIFINIDYKSIKLKKQSNYAKSYNRRGWKNFIL